MEKYQITKTVRFKLEPVGDKAKNLKGNFSGNKLPLENLIQRLEEVGDTFVKIFYSKDDDGNAAFNGLFKIKYSWMRTYLKNEFYDRRKNSISKTKDYELKDLDYVWREVNERWLPEWKYIIQRLKEFQEAKKESYFRKSEIGFIINQLAKRTNFELIKEFVDSIVATQKTEVDNSIAQLKFLLSEKQLQETITNYQRSYLPSQTNGVVVAGGSLNYYTINKTTKFEEKISETQRALNKKLSLFPPKRDGSAQFFLANDLVTKIGLPSNLFEMSLDEAYKFLKKWKSDKKNAILELAQKKAPERILELSDIQENGEFFLFNSSEANLKEFIKLTHDIGELANEKNSDTTPEHTKRELKKEITRLKADRGLFFNTPEKPIQTNNYKLFCEFYKSIALRRGQELARQKAIEKERILAKHLSYWCAIAEKENSHFLYMIPRTGEDNLKKAKEYIESINPNNTSNGTKLYFFHSLTLHALRKLCFKSVDNTFKKETGKRDYPFFEQAMKEESDRIKFYQEILKIWKEKGNPHYGLNLVNFDITELTTKKYRTLEDFEIALNKVCYVKKVYISNEAEKELVNKFQAICFKITSYDIKHNLEHGNQNFKNKRHTDIWFDFWKNSNDSKYPLRLNPEIKITWREARENRVKKYLKNPELFDPKKKNRFIHDQFTLNTTFLENAHHKKFDFAFTDHETIKSAIQEFNTKLEKENTGEWIYGIDRGEKELATLCLVKFLNGDKTKPEFPKLNLYRLKPNKYYFQDEGKTKTGQVEIKKEYSGPIKNISYHLDKLNPTKSNEWFEKISDNESACFDLTTAKVIKSHIILNGDLTTFYNLKKLVAMREIFELFRSGKLDQDSEIKFRGSGNDFLSIYNGINVLKVNRTSGEEKNGIIIYRLSPEQKINFKQFGVPSIIIDLNEYLKSLVNKTGTPYEPSIEKINHLRDSITANIVGIIKFLHKDYPMKSISLENLDKVNDERTGNKFIVDHFIQSETSIDRRLEWSLYRSLQDLSLVPPSLRETILLKDEFQYLKFGVVKFVEVKGTSSNCPVCNIEHGKSKDHYICKDSVCGFSTKDNRKGLAPLTNSDKVAAYNIAKRGLEIFNG